MTHSLRDMVRRTTQLGLVASLMLAVPALSADEARMSWEEIVAAAAGQTVNWYMWGGSDTINNYVSGRLGALALQEGITLNRVGINDTADAVNTVLSEVEAGIEDDGSVDLIWINGENFRTMRQADLVFCRDPGVLPNSKYVNWDDPSIAFDFGTPVDGCEIPWNRTQFAFGHDTARVAAPPRSLAQLLEWIRANPGRFTYPAPPDFTGSAFVRHVFYHVAGGPDRLLGEFDQDVYDEVAPFAWELLNGIRPHLWRQGGTYPKDATALAQLFANQEVDFHFSYSASTFGTMVDDGTFPPTTRSFGLADGTLGNTNYVAIPRNAANKAGALVLLNILLDPGVQLDKAHPDVWGQATVLDIDRLPAGIRAGFADLPRHPSVVPATELARHVLPELQAEWLTAIERGWQENVGRR